jgi:membrane fusion protein, heavy metal efflux system
VLIRSEIADPEHLLRSGMFATFVIRVADPIRAVSVPADGVVREGDGTITVWVTSDRRRFTRRTIKTGIRRGGVVQVLEGLQPGELVATEAALFLSNTFTSGERS